MNGVARGLRAGSDAGDIIRPSLVDTRDPLTPTHTTNHGLLARTLTDR